MLKEVISISGKPGLYKLLKTNKTGFIVESFSDKRKIPVGVSERVVSLREISIYTSEGDYSLGSLLDKIYTENEGKKIDLNTFGKDKESFFEYFEKILPSYDKEMVHANEIKKILTWYNILVENGFEKFANIEKEEKEKTEEKESK